MSALGLIPDFCWAAGKRHLLPFLLGVGSGSALTYLGASVLHYLFGFGGRINRAKMWLFLLIAAIWIWFCFNIAWLLGRPLGPLNAFVPALLQPLQVRTAAWLSDTPFYVCAASYYFALAAVSVKRLHDRGKGAIWLVLFFGVPSLLLAVEIAEIWFCYLPPAMHEPAEMVITLIANVCIWWWFVELFFLRGTRGDNRFGPDPLVGKP